MGMGPSTRECIKAEYKILEFPSFCVLHRHLPPSLPLFSSGQIKAQWLGGNKTQEPQIPGMVPNQRSLLLLWWTSKESVLGILDQAGGPTPGEVLSG